MGKGSAMDSAGDQGPPKCGFGLLDTRTANMVGYYESEEAALLDVAADIGRFGTDAPEVLSLALFRYHGSAEQASIAAGPALIARALQAARATSPARSHL